MKSGVHSSQRALHGILSAIIALGAGGCGLVGASTDVRLGVPYFSQPSGSQWCGPASIAMWIKFNGFPTISQQTIASRIGANWYTGASAESIAYGVNYYTATRDAYVDREGEMYGSDFVSRQITSIDNRTPVIALVQNETHAGVVNGGKWHRWGSGYQWDYVYFHDPSPDFGGANVRYSSGDWLDFSMASGGTLSQIISHASVLQWQSNQLTFGDRIRINGDPCLDQLERPICP